MSENPATAAPHADAPGAQHADAHDYVVVARRYRPQQFGELIGQSHVARALTGAIEADRVGHAYLFTGARGVGKTSAARILAKALNCVEGMGPTPCGRCEICENVAAGDDVDVLEIDGASNRGIDEIRQLRQNVAVRPSRARFKIYIIDEVHMLTKEAFNALLKTLEEPPEHVKFIFATTEPNKIPITILSRCQRYDFAGIDASAIHDRLAQIAAAEGVEVEPDALALLAMRAAGSMRDSQSLLEQLLSTGSRAITAADVTGLLGLAPAARLSQLVTPLVDRDAAAALAEFDAALAEGAEVGQLIDQLLGYFRDVMTQCVGCGPERLLHALPGQRDEISGVAQRLGVQTLLAISGILDHAASRLRVSTQVRTLAEMAIVRICRLGDLDDLATLIEAVKSGAVPAPAAGGATAPAPLKKNGAADGPVNPGAGATSASPAAASSRTPAQASPPTPAPTPSPASATAAAEQPVAPPAATPRPQTPAPPTAATPSKTPPSTATPSNAPQSTAALSTANVGDVWRQALQRLEGFARDHAAAASGASVDGQGRLVLRFARSFDSDACGKPGNRSAIETAVADACGERVGIVFEVDRTAASTSSAPAPKSLRQRQAEIASDPFVQKAMDLFGGDPNRMKFIPPRSE